MIKKSTLKTIKSIVKEIWKEEIPKDYKRKFLLKEDTLKNTLYYHLRTKLGDGFLRNNNLRIYTEYYIERQRIDLVIAEVDEECGGTLNYCVTDLAIAMELKYKNSIDDDLFYSDVSKTLNYLDTFKFHSCHYYLAFIQEVVFDDAEKFKWLNKQQSTRAKGRVTELTQFLNPETDEPDWKVIEH